MRKFAISKLLPALALGLSCSAYGGTIIGGDFVVTTLASGAVQSVVYKGTEFFSWGTPVGDYSLAQGSAFGSVMATGLDTLTFLGNNSVGNPVYGLAGTQISIQPNSVQIDQLFRPCACLQLDPTIINSALNAQSALFALSFDPDQDLILGTPDTLNDAGTITRGLGGTVSYALAEGPISGKTVILAVLEGLFPSSITTRAAAGSPFQITSATDIASVFSNPYDGNGARADGGLHLVRQYGNIPAQTGLGSSFFLIFGDTKADALAGMSRLYELDAPPPGTIPEPSTWMLCGSAILALAISRRKISPRN